MAECSFTKYMVVDSSTTGITKTSDMALVLSKKVLDIKANKRLWIHSLTRTRHDKNILSNATY